MTILPCSVSSDNQKSIPRTGQEEYSKLRQWLSAYLLSFPFPLSPHFFLPLPSLSPTPPSLWQAHGTGMKFSASQRQGKHLGNLSKYKFPDHILGDSDSKQLVEPWESVFLTNMHPPHHPQRFDEVFCRPECEETSVKWWKSWTWKSRIWFWIQLSHSLAG